MAIRDMTVLLCIMSFSEFQVENEMRDESVEAVNDDNESCFFVSESSEDDPTRDVVEDEECDDPEGINSNDDD